MIDRREILEAATRMSLNPHVVEKDYVLGWMLAGIDAHPVLRESWVFKGGTCLKKCFFETYRFSEDLDFTLREPRHLEEGFLKDAFAQIGAWIYDRSGIQVPAEAQKFDIYTNPRGSFPARAESHIAGRVAARYAAHQAGPYRRMALVLLRRGAGVSPYTDDPADGIWRSPMPMKSCLVRR